MDQELADRLERHEEYSNGVGAQWIGGELWDRDDALLIYSAPSFGTGLNFACRVRSDAESVEPLVDQIVEWFSRHGVKPHVRVSPLSQPANLAQTLERRGFVGTEKETQMVLAGEDTEHPTNPRVMVEQVEMGDIERWVELQYHGFGEPDAPPALAVKLARATVALGGLKPYWARLEGEPVAAGMPVFWEGVRGIYGVGTLPKARGQGVATALVRRMIQDAKADGDAPICLQVETGSATQRWYERLGFRTVYDRTGWTLNG